MKKAVAKKPVFGRPGKPKGRRRTDEGYDLLTDAPGTPLARPGVGAPKKENLGDRVRKARKLRGLSLGDLSLRAGIGEDTLVRIEANEIIPPLGELIKIGKAVEMKMGYFISPGGGQPMTVVRREARPLNARCGKKPSPRSAYSYESLASGKGGRFMEPFFVTLLPGAEQEPSVHEGQEFIFVLEGEMKARVGLQEETLRPGDAIYYDSAYPHRFACAGNRPTKILAVLYPGTK